MKKATYRPFHPFSISLNMKISSKCTRCFECCEIRFRDSHTHKKAITLTKLPRDSYASLKHFPPSTIENTNKSGFKPQTICSSLLSTHPHQNCLQRSIVSVVGDICGSKNTCRHSRVLNTPSK